MADRTTPLISFVAARSGTGKTTLLEKVVSLLTAKGVRVVTIKDIHQAQLDLPGKDSWRHRQAGALAVGLVAEDEYLIIGRREEGERDPRQLLPFLPAADLVLVEGFRRSDLPKIEVVRSELGREIVSPPETLVAVATDVPGLRAAVPVFPLDEAGPLSEWLWTNHLAPVAGQLSHVDAAGRARMVDVSEKDDTVRVAVARGEIMMRPATLEMIVQGRMPKGDVLAVARVAGIMAAKETSRLIPLCHPLNITGLEIDFEPDQDRGTLVIEARVRLRGQTGVEMEALTGVSVAALTIYDMCKAVDRGMEIGRIRLMEKAGGRSGHFVRSE